MTGCAGAVRVHPRPGALGTPPGAGAASLPVLRVAALDLPPEPAQVAVARRSIRAAVCGWGLEALADDCVLAVSELVTNAVSAAAGITGPGGVPAAVRVRVTALDGPAGVLVEVRDASPDMPRPVTAGPDSPGGRGLAIVAALAARHGAERDGPGKRVWAEITRDSREARPASGVPAGRSRQP